MKLEWERGTKKGRNIGGQDRAADVSFSNGVWCRLLATSGPGHIRHRASDAPKICVHADFSLGYGHPIRK